MLAHRVFDHCFIRGEHESGTGGEYEEPDRFQSFDRGVGQTAIQVVDQYHELVDAGFLQQAVERLAERGNLFRRILGAFPA